MLDGKPMSQEEMKEVFRSWDQHGPVQAGQSEEEVEKAWEKYKKEHNL